ncbi:PTS fructose transporter subunit IIA [Clostridioides sp. ES-S-0108-01]|uniref:PTS sugar transporter subunit IIA n=1 Tax=unclassified Clostridioides TaxID=2635829 RepID=UPI001D0CCAD5|nr:PTS fructose transporter subunit IIA [Clostridioides sp. ES-S-0171-01]MCC0689825.1 PTS fructose transporter subunit IIA [Clostridioides sp. ES-S-0056-01]MCC0715660.1 PTS fructose transporter subunit IIA [Clostridioides sp. ES-S-0077-01]MCC0784910.1 PTS fructose transporter subunit IIA [Clostridioides sp. ES-S-0108-01]UDN50974.1 PTS fructose transporter subunit IIA [Clostridioides sp. ES-S-0107-01]UDN54462.1 PTS fructose transporter subunit IIA [Clostridioides sp. ES-S-0054-01]
MNQIILASHGSMAKGIKNALEMIIGNAESVKAFSSYRDEEENIKVLIEKVIKENYETKEIFILTDILGGSVNNEMMSLLKDYPKIHIISGINLPLVISIAICNEISIELLKEFIKDSQQSIVYCNELIRESISGKDEDL